MFGARAVSSTTIFETAIHSGGKICHQLCIVGPHSVKLEAALLFVRKPQGTQTLALGGAASLFSIANRLVRLDLARLHQAGDVDFEGRIGKKGDIYRLGHAAG